jgi:CheY-like chemotaxis protein
MKAKPKKKILVMDDDEKILAALVIRLEAAGYEVLTARDGFDGLKLTMNETPDLLLMDIWMPVGLGLSVAQRLNRLGLDGIPKIFMTASQAKGLKQAALDQGAVAFFEKPYDSAKLLQTIADALAESPDRSPAAHA